MPGPESGSPRTRPCRTTSPPRTLHTCALRSLDTDANFSLPQGNTRSTASSCAVHVFTNPPTRRSRSHRWPLAPPTQMYRLSGDTATVRSPQDDSLPLSSDTGCDACGPPPVPTRQSVASSGLRRSTWCTDDCVQHRIWSMPRLHSPGETPHSAGAPVAHVNCVEGSVRRRVVTPACVATSKTWRLPSHAKASLCPSMNPDANAAPPPVL
mmetsp:Transcript_12476/g.42173  ORF Transcript_12476/g.42173 Transcript_12476/m.42173 type:complete len:210 (-) Transcript_12476:311-940(-)